MRLSSRQYAQALLDATSGRTGRETADVVAAFLARLRREKGMRSLPAIVRALERLEEERSGITRVTAVVARGWKGDKSLISKVAGKVFGAGKTAVDVRVKPALLGGLLLRTEDTVWDATVRTRLDRLGRVLSKD